MEKPPAKSASPTDELPAGPGEIPAPLVFDDGAVITGGAPVTASQSDAAANAERSPGRRWRPRTSRKTRPAPISPRRMLDVTGGPIRSTLFWLALPTLGEQALNACVTWNDSLMAGRISAEATGAVGFAGYVGWLMTMMFGLVGTGATAIIARSIGSGDRRRARHAANQAVVLAVAIGLGGMVFVFAAAPLFARLLNMKGDAFAIAVAYMRIDATGMIGAAVSFALAACLRGAGDTRTPLKILGGVNVWNLVVSWVLTFGIGPWSGIGVHGIVIGTATARWAGAFWIVFMMLRRGHPLRLHPVRMRPDRKLLSGLMRIGLPAAADGALTFSGHFVFMSIVSRIPSIFPTPVIYAAHIVGVRVESLCYLPANGYMFAAATFVGQNLGAGRADRARASAHEALRQTLYIVGFMAVVISIGAPVFYRVLSNDPEVWECGVPALRGLAIFQFALAPLIIFLGSLRGAGDTRTPMLITIFGMGCVRIPMAYVGGFILKWGLLGAWLGMFSDMTVRAILMWLVFRSGRWARVRV